eukprot:795233_1
MAETRRRYDALDSHIREWRQFGPSEIPVRRTNIVRDKRRSCKPRQSPADLLTATNSPKDNQDSFDLEELYFLPVSDQSASESESLSSSTTVDTPKVRQITTNSITESSCKRKHNSTLFRTPISRDSTKESIITEPNIPSSCKPKPKQIKSKLRTPVPPRKKHKHFLRERESFSSTKYRLLTRSQSRQAFVRATNRKAFVRPTNRKESVRATDRTATRELTRAQSLLSLRRGDRSSVKKTRLRSLSLQEPDSVRKLRPRRSTIPVSENFAGAVNTERFARVLDILQRPGQRHHVKSSRIERNHSAVLFDMSLLL